VNVITDGTSEGTVVTVCGVIRKFKNVHVRLRDNCVNTFFRNLTILTIKTNEMHYFSNLFWYRTLHVSDRFTVHHQESSTVYTAIGVCHAD
jgi:hypothetical protein